MALTQVDFLTCWRAAWRSHLGWVCMSIGAILSLGVGTIAGHVLGHYAPVVSVVKSISIEDVSPGNRDLIAVIESSRPSNCVRISQQLLFRDEDGGPEFIPLGSALTGPTLGLTSGGSGGVFKLRLPLPASVPDKEYKFVHRSIYFCTWLGGLIVNTSTYETLPVTIALTSNS